MKILISAAEASSDVHGAHLLEALRAQAVAAGIARVDAFGIGGPKLEAAGLRRVVDARELLAIGFGELLGRLPKIRAALRTISAEAIREKPDIAVLIDYPDFHFRLARKLHAAGIPVVYFIPPKVWAWRKGRVQDLRELFAKVLCIFPFEESFYREERIPVRYVGNPLVDELPWELSRAEARQRLGIPADARTLLLMPGSRPAELKRHTELFLEAAAITSRKVGPLKVLLALPMTADLAETRARLERWQSLDVRLSQGDAHVCMAAADAGLVKSGTSTLEAALLGCPHAVVYRTNIVTRLIFKNLIRYAGPVGMVNLVFYGPNETRKRLMRELLLEQATPEALAEEATRLLSDAAYRGTIDSGMKLLRQSVLGGNGDLASRLRPSETAAREILELARGARKAD